MNIKTEIINWIAFTITITGILKEIDPLLAAKIDACCRTEFEKRFNMTCDQKIDDDFFDQINKEVTDLTRFLSKLYSDQR